MTDSLKKLAEDSLRHSIWYGVAYVGRFMGENVVRVQLGTGDFCDPPSR